MKRFFSKLLMWIAIIIAIICIVILEWFSAGTINIFFTTISMSAFAWGGLAISFGLMILAYTIDPDAASQVVQRASQVVGDVVSGAAKAVGRGVKGVVDGLGLFNIALLGIGAYAIYKFSSGGENVTVKNKRELLVSNKSSHSTTAHPNR